MSLKFIGALCLLALLGDTFSSALAQQQVGSNLSSSSRIHSGMETRQGDLPFVMKLKGTQVNDNSETVCSSFLIHPHWLLTAAHCKEPLHRYEVLINSPPETGETIFHVSEDDWVVHHKFIVNGVKDHRNDLALIHLANFHYNVTPVAIANSSSDPWTTLKKTRGAMLAPAGYGQIDQSGTYATQVRKTFMYPEPDCPDAGCPALCSPYHGDREPMFCVRGGPAFEGICPGDSGGPYLFEDAKSKIAFGVISLGFVKACSTDADRMPWNEVHWAVRISWHLEWIKEKLCDRGDWISYMDYQCP